MNQTNYVTLSKNSLKRQKGIAKMKVNSIKFAHKSKHYRIWFTKPERKFDLFTSPIFRLKMSAPKASKHTRALARRTIGTTLGSPRRQGGTHANRHSRENYLNTENRPKRHSLQLTNHETRKSQPSQHWIDEDNNHLSGSSSRPTSRPSSRPTSRSSSRTASRPSSQPHQGHHHGPHQGSHRGPPRDRLRDPCQGPPEDQPQRNRLLRRIEGTSHYSHKTRMKHFWRYQGLLTGRNNSWQR